MYGEVLGVIREQLALAETLERDESFEALLPQRGLEEFLKIQTFSNSQRQKFSNSLKSVS